MCCPNAMRLFVLAFLTCPVGASQAQTPPDGVAPDAPDRPNIIYLLSDDHALRTIGAYGNDLQVTPNLNCIAAKAPSSPTHSSPIRSAVPAARPS